MRHVDGDALLDECERIYDEYMSDAVGKEMLKAIEKAKTIDDGREHRHWKRVWNMSAEPVEIKYVCSHCGTFTYRRMFPYCPDCGAKMD